MGSEPSDKDPRQSGQNPRVGVHEIRKLERYMKRQDRELNNKEKCSQDAGQTLMGQNNDELMENLRDISLGPSPIISISTEPLPTDVTTTSELTQNPSYSMGNWYPGGGVGDVSVSELCEPQPTSDDEGFKFCAPTSLIKWTGGDQVEMDCSVQPRDSWPPLEQLDMPSIEDRMYWPDDVLTTPEKQKIWRAESQEINYVWILPSSSAGAKPPSFTLRTEAGYNGHGSGDRSKMWSSADNSTTNSQELAAYFDELDRECESKLTMPRDKLVSMYFPDLEVDARKHKPSCRCHKNCAAKLATTFKKDSRTWLYKSKTLRKAVVPNSSILGYLWG